MNLILGNTADNSTKTFPAVLVCLQTHLFCHPCHILRSQYGNLEVEKSSVGLAVQVYQAAAATQTAVCWTASVQESLKAEET